jgi:hypothetical protein
MKWDFCHVSVKPNSSQNFLREYVKCMDVNVWIYCNHMYLNGSLKTLKSGSDLSGRGNHFVIPPMWKGNIATP